MQNLPLDMSVIFVIHLAISPTSYTTLICYAEYSNTWPFTSNQRILVVNVPTTLKEITSPPFEILF
jgi:hypothetical protein